MLKKESWENIAESSRMSLWRVFVALYRKNSKMSEISVSRPAGTSNQNFDGKFEFYVLNYSYSDPGLRKEGCAFEELIEQTFFQLLPRTMLKWYMGVFRCK